MPILRYDGKAARINSRFAQITPDGDIVLTLKVQGTCFPAKRAISTSGIADFRSVDGVSNKIYIDYADGTGEHSYDFKSSGASRRIFFTNRTGQTNPATVAGTGVYDQNPLHFYQDLPVGIKNTVNDSYPTQRTIRIRFEKPQSITYIRFVGFYAFGIFPASIAKLKSLEQLSISTLAFLTAFAQDFYNSRIRIFVVSNAGSLLNNGFSEWMLNSPLESINLNSSADFSGDPVTKKLSRINELKDTLKTISIPDTKIDYPIPDTFNELYKLETANVGDNTSPTYAFCTNVTGLVALKELNAYSTRWPFTEHERLMRDLPAIETYHMSNCQINTDKDIALPNTKVKTLYIGWNNLWNNRAVPTFISKMTALEILRMDYPQGENSTSDNLRNYGDFSACTSLKWISISQQSLFETNIPAWFSALVNLKTFSCWGTFLTQARMDAFVDNFYAFVVANASLTPGASKFRQMSVDAYGVSATLAPQMFRPSGSYTAPAGFVLNVSNGTPTTPMQKIYCLINNYQHSWNVKPT